jgi:predicted RNA binding protein YcfA (HicA-like mRNA interferase family)
MKKREIEKRLRGFGWWLKRQGGNHEIWTNGNLEGPVPRHGEIGEMLAKKILKKAASNPPKKK